MEIVPVDEDTKKSLEQARKDHDAKWKELMDAVVQDVDLENLDVDGSGYSTHEISSKSRTEVVEIISDRISDEMVRKKAIEMVDLAFVNGFKTRRTGRVLAASAEYSARLKLGEKRTQSDLSNEYGCTMASIRETYQEMIHYSDDFV